MDEQVRAAGGVVLRRGGNGQSEVLVVHRPAYDDWSLPKGKLLDGEQWRTAAVREVHEETGVSAEPGAELTPTRYRDHRGRAKQVRWWRMQPRHDQPRAADDEVDQHRWVSPEEAEALLTYASDRALVREALDGAR